MKKLIRIELERMLRNKMFLGILFIGILITMIEFFLVPMKNSLDIIGKYNGNVNDTISTVFNSWFFSLNYKAIPLRKLYVMIMPLLATFAYCGSYISDIKNGYLKNLYTRTEKYKYLLSKCIISNIAGGVAVVFPLLLNLALCSMVLPSVKMEPVLGFYEPGGFKLMSNIAYSHPYIYVFIYVIIVFLYCSIFSTCSLIIAQFAPISFVALIFPFVLNYFCYIIQSFLGLSKYNPMKLMTIGYSYTNTLWGVFIEWLVIEGVLFFIYMWKGMRSEAY